MQKLYKKSLLEGVALEPKLEELLAEGFTEIDGCYFLNSMLKKNTNVERDVFPDCTGFECFINSFYINDYVTRDVLEQGVLFLDEVISNWIKYSRRDLRCILIFADDLKLKMHVEREGENWLCEDLEVYDEPILCASSAGYQVDSTVRR